MLISVLVDMFFMTLHHPDYRTSRVSPHSPSKFLNDSHSFLVFLGTFISFTPSQLCPLILSHSDQFIFIFSTMIDWIRFLLPSMLIAVGVATQSRALLAYMSLYLSAIVFSEKVKRLAGYVTVGMGSLLRS